MIFSQNFKTSWHDTDANRNLRLTQLLVYMQEASNGHLNAVGFNLDKLRDEKGLAFILSKLRLEIFSPLHAYEDITAQTWTTTSKGFSFNRCYRIMRGDEVVAAADSVWALVCIKDRSLCKTDTCDFQFLDEDPVTLSLPSRFRVPRTEELELLGERRIVYSDLDYNMHMNNTRYADMLCDFLPYEKIASIRGISLSYLHESAFGDNLKIYSRSTENTADFRTVNSQGNACLEAQIIFN